MLNLRGNKIGVVCVGGGGAGVIQAGMLRALDDKIGWNNVHAVSGASVGSLNAAMFVQGRTRELCRLWENLRRKDVYKYNIFSWKSFLNPKPLYRLIEEYINIEAIRRSSVHLVILSTNSDTGEAVWATNTTPDLVTYLKGSSAIPAIFPEVQSPEGWLIDGGVSDNSPTEPLAKLGCDTIYILHAHPEREVLERTKPVNRRAAIKKAITALYLANQELDIKRIEDMNQLVREGKAPGKKIIEIHNVYPTIEVGTLEFDPKSARARILHGYERGLAVFPS